MWTLFSRALFLFFKVTFLISSYCVNDPSSFCAATKMTSQDFKLKWISIFSTLFFVLPDGWSLSGTFRFCPNIYAYRWLKRTVVYMDIVILSECNEYVCSVSQHWLWVSSLFPFKTNVVNHRKCSLDESPTAMMIITLSINMLAVELVESVQFWHIIYSFWIYIMSTVLYWIMYLKSLLLY